MEKASSHLKSTVLTVIVSAIMATMVSFATVTYMANSAYRDIIAKAEEKSDAAESFRKADMALKKIENYEERFQALALELESFRVADVASLTDREQEMSLISVLDRQIAYVKDLHNQILLVADPDKPYNAFQFASLSGRVQSLREKLETLEIQNYDFKDSIRTDLQDGFSTQWTVLIAIFIGVSVTMGIALLGPTYLEARRRRAPSNSDVTARTEALQDGDSQA